MTFASWPQLLTFYVHGPWKHCTSVKRKLLPVYIKMDRSLKWLFKFLEPFQPTYVFLEEKNWFCSDIGIQGSVIKICIQLLLPLSNIKRITHLPYERLFQCPIISIAESTIQNWHWCLPRVVLVWSMLANMAERGEALLAILLHSGCVHMGMRIKWNLFATCYIVK